MLTWKTTDVFLRGTIVKAFLPFEKYPRLNNENLKSLYPGDEVYIFETTDNNKWGRGYAVTLPFPHDFSLNSVKLDEIPTQNISVSVFPMNYVKILEQIPFSLEDDNRETPDALDIESVDHKPTTTTLHTNKSTKVYIPPFPIQNLNETNCFIREIKDAIELLTSHIFTFFSIGEFGLFYELSLINYELYELRFKLLHDILTTKETEIAKRSAINLLNKFPKVLASGYERISFLFNGSDKENSDTYGYKALLARDTFTGSILSYSNSIPLRIAFDQLLCSIPPDNLTNIYLEEPGFTSTTKSKKMYSQKLQHDLLFDLKSFQVCSNAHPTTFHVGEVLHSDINVDNVLQYENYFKNGDIGIRQLSTKLVEFHQIEFQQLARYFGELLNVLFSIADISTKQPQSETQQDLKYSTFNAIVFLIDTILNKYDIHSYLIALFTEKKTDLPLIGTFLMENISRILFQAETNWTKTSTRVCRIFSILMNFAIRSFNSPDVDEHFKALGNISESVAYFLSLKSDSYIDDQVLIIDTLDDILPTDFNIDDIETMKLIVIFIDSIGTKGLGIDGVLYITNKVYINNRNSKTENAHRIVISKLLLIHRLFFTKMVEEPTTRKILLSKAIEWAMEAIQGQTDVAASRIACSVLNCVCTLLWKLVTKGNQEEIQLCHLLIKLLPSISRAIIKYERFTRENGFYKPKNKISLIFPGDYPFMEVPVDPLIKEEVLVEIQVELATMFCFIARIGKYVSGDFGIEAILRIQSNFDSSKYLLDDFQSKDLTDLLFAVNIIRRGKFIPYSKWLSLYSLLVEGCVVSLELIKPLLHAYFIPSFGSQKKFNIIIWGNFLKSLLQLAVTIPISIEYLPKTPRQSCYQITGEIRDKIACMFYESWNLLGMETDVEIFNAFNISRLGGYQMKFINSQYCVLHDLMLFALQNNSVCQTVGSELLWSIMVTYFIEKKSIIDVERQCLLGLRDVYYNNAYKPSSLEQEKFMEQLKKKITVKCESEAIEVFSKFTESLEGFLTALNEYICIPMDPVFAEDRKIHELKINAYLKSANKPELFDSLINTIYEENLEKNNYIQAALTMELLASTYSWDQNTILRASLRPKFQRQTSFERKETLFNIIAKNFIRGNNLERALETYNELLDSYRLYTYDLKRFANIHTKIANLYKRLATSDSFSSSSYFKVEYIGLGFPPSINGTIQIYEGSPFERIKSFQNRMLELYPGAQIIPDHWEALKLMQSSQSGKYLHISTVEPVSEITGRSILATNRERKYAKNNELRYFSLIRKLGEAKSIYDLWTEEITYETNLRFPTILNKSEVRNIKVVKLSPLDNAVRTIEHMHDNLAQVETKLINAFKEKSEYSSLLKDLRVLLSGAIDSPVNGGVEQYRKFMYDNEYGDNQNVASQKLMKIAFDKLCVILDKCLQIHSKLVTPDMVPFHDSLSQLYKKNFAEEIERLRLTSEHSSAYNHNYYPSRASFETEIYLTLSSSETGVSISASDISLFGLSSLKLSMRASKLFNWKKLRNQRQR